MIIVLHNDLLDTKPNMTRLHNHQVLNQMTTGYYIIVISLLLSCICDCIQLFKFYM